MEWRNCATREADTGLNMISARVTRGAISLSSSAHLPPTLGPQIGEPGRVATWTRQARNEALGNRLADPHEHDWKRARHLLRPAHGRRAVCEDQVRCEGEQFRGRGARPLGFGNTPP